MIIDTALLDNVTMQAENSPRLRMNFNLHEAPDSKAQRLLNVLLPGTPMPIHRHSHTAETYIILRGRMIVVFYSETGAQMSRTMLDPTIGNHGIHIPAGQWHGIEVIEPTTIFEVKDGPYTPLTPDNMLD